MIGVEDPSEAQPCKQIAPSDSKKQPTSSWSGPEKLTRADDPRHTLRENGGLVDLWHMDDGEILCHPILVPSYLQEFDVANAKVGAERNSVEQKSSTS